MTNSQLIETRGELLILDQREKMREKIIIVARGGSYYGNGMIADGKIMVSVAR